MKHLALVCVGAGRGERFGGDKLAERLGDASVLETSLGALRSAHADAPMILVVAATRVESWSSELAERWPELRVVKGGARRQDSVKAGVDAARALGAEAVLIHDAARPLVHPEDVAATAAGLDLAPGVVLCARIVDTVKRVAPGGRVLETVDRGSLRAAQTPQAFRIAALEEAWQRVGDDEQWTDEAAILEAAGLPVHCIVAAHPNPKLTEAGDLVVVRALAGRTR